MKQEEATQTITPSEEYWVCFEGVSPTRVGPATLQRLVNGKGSQIQVMDIKQEGGWKTAADFGFESEQIAPPRPPKTLNSVINLQTQTQTQVSPRYMTPEKGIMFILKEVKDGNTMAQVTLLMPTGREKNVPISVAEGNVRYKGALIVKDSYISEDEVGQQIQKSDRAMMLHLKEKAASREQLLRRERTKQRQSGDFA